MKTAAGGLDTWTADRCAEEWDVAVATWRGYVATDRAPRPLPGYDEQRRRRWSPEAVRTYPRPGQGQRTDLAAGKIGELLALAKVIAGDRHYDECSKIGARVFDGDPGGVRSMIAGARRWARRSPDQTGRLARVEALATELGDLGAALLPMRMREQILIAEAKALTATDETPSTTGEQL